MIKKQDYYDTLILCKNMLDGLITNIDSHQIHLQKHLFTIETLINTLQHILINFNNKKRLREEEIE